MPLFPENGNLAVDRCIRIKKMTISADIAHIDLLAFDNVPEEDLPDVDFDSIIAESKHFSGNPSSRGSLTCTA